MKIVTCLLLCTLAIFPAAAEDQPISRIAFGSCASQDRPLPIFDRMVELKPEIYLALGDNIYADTTDMAVMKSKYDKLADTDQWKKLKATCPILATWDDHDLGRDDAGEDYPKREESQELFLDFFGVAKDDPVRKQRGIYTAKIVGPENQRVQFIMLDCRYFRSNLEKGPRLPGSRVEPYIPNTAPEATMLGEEQWKWLEEQLQKPAELRIISSSIQVISEEHPYEKWANIPKERQRLYNLIVKTKARGVVLLSGDRHLADISMRDDLIGYPLYDLTSSGLNQGSKVWRAPEPNKFRVGGMPHGDNFGLIEIDWKSRLISMQLRDVDGEIAVKDKIKIDLLVPPGTIVKADPLPHTPGEGAISPRDARSSVGQEVVVEMKVQSAGQSATRMFLNSEKDFRDKLNFAVVLGKEAFTGTYEKATTATFQDQIIRVTGKVSTFRGEAQIVITDAKQLEILKK
ncbi:MAG: alkaline phosphatase D family protein [Zavarzinella sp.]